MPTDPPARGNGGSPPPCGRGRTGPSGELFRLLIDDPHDGAWNMAADEILLDGAADGGERAVRLYRWRPPTWSLGRLQRWEGSVDERFCRGNGIGIVRRPTGGRALLHDSELTYAVAAPADRGAFAGSILETYRAIAAVLAEAMRRVGARVGIEAGTATPGAGALCFATSSAFEIVSADARRSKLAGSAQLRRRSAFLQHGSIPLEMNAALQAGAAGVQPTRGKGEHVTLSEVCGRPVSFEELARALEQAFPAIAGIEFARGNWSAGEKERIERLRADRYLTAAWTREGRDEHPMHPFVSL